MNVQRDKGRPRRGGMFTMNVGLYIPQVERGLTRELVEGVPGSDWTLAVRVGILTHGADHWWQLAPSPDIAASAEELRSAWRAHVKPWLDRHDDPRDVRDWMAGHAQAFQAAVLSHGLGDPDRSRAVPVAHFAPRSNPDDPAVSWAREVGILTDQAAAKLRWALIQDTATLTSALRELFAPTGGTGRDGGNVGHS